MHSLSSAATTFVAQNYGAEKKERIKEGIKKSFILNFCIILFLSLLLIFQAHFFASLFSEDEEVLFYAERFIYLTAPFFVICGFSMLCSHILRGYGIVFLPTLITFLGFVLFRQLMLLIISHTVNSFTLIALVYPSAWPLVVIIYLVWFFIRQVKSRTAL